MLKKSLAIASLLALTACASAPKLLLNDGKTSLLQSDKVYTQTNLHPDEDNGRLYSVNYQKQGFIPRCSEVEIVEVDTDELTFKVNGQEFEYLYDESSKSFDKNIQKYFGPSCDKFVLTKLNDMDKKGLEQGQVYKGMTKRGVILAIGYPPLRETPTTRDKVWKYWLNSDDSFSVLFDRAGTVKYIKH